jgi:hypothetical protein
MADEIRYANKTIMSSYALAKQRRDENAISESFVATRDTAFYVLVAVTRLVTGQHPDLKAPDWTPLFPLLGVTATVITKAYEESKLLLKYVNTLSAEQQVMLSCVCLLFKVQGMVVTGILPTTSQADRVAAYEKYTTKIHPRFKPQFEQATAMLRDNLDIKFVSAINNNMEFCSLCLRSLATNGTLREARHHIADTEVLQRLRVPGRPY